MREPISKKYRRIWRKDRQSLKYQQGDYPREEVYYEHNIKDIEMIRQVARTF